MHENQTFGDKRQLQSKVATLQELLEAMERTVIEQSIRLQEALSLAHRVSLAKSEFLSNMSREIQTPMNAVLGMADLLAETRLSAEQRQYLDLMVANGHSLADLINSILDLARIDSGRLQLEHTQFGLTHLIERTISTFAVQAHGKGLELVARIAPGVPDYLVGDPLRLRQIVVNLIGNAVKFTKSGAVALEVEANPRSSALADLRVSISDTGAGITADKLDSIRFNFAHPDSSILRQCGGTGVGLAIAKRLVDLMQGKISVTSEVGKGSTFCFTAPFGVPCSILLPVAPALPDLSGQRVLVVDGHQLNRQMVRETIVNCRGEVTEASSAAEAMQAIRTAVAAGRPFRIILLDMRMPEMDGLELARKVRREQLPTGPLIPMPYSGDIRQQVARFKEHRLAAYLVKPITRRELFKAIGNKMAESDGHSPHDDGLEKLPREPIFARADAPKAKTIVAKLPRTGLPR